MTDRPEGAGADDGTVTWRQLLGEARDRLAVSGFENPDVDARRIIERASGFEGAEYVIALEEPATQRGVHFFDLMLTRRLRGEPLQYVLGRWSFRTLDLFVDGRVLIPRPETEVVVGFAIDELLRLRKQHETSSDRRPARQVVVDLGTGSGAIGLSMATECADVEVWATDKSPDALAVARANLTGIGQGATRVRLVEGSWFDALPDELRGEVDLIVSNPPYVAETDQLPSEVIDWEPPDALFAGPTGLEALDEIVSSANHWLRSPGVIVVESAPSQCDYVAELAQKCGFDHVVGFEDLAGRERGVIARKG